MPLECLGCWFFCAVWAVIQQKCPWLWKYVENVLWASCSFIFSTNCCDPTAKHYAVMYPLKLARGLPGKFNVFLWCLHGTSLNMNGKFFSTKGCSSSSTENLGKIEDICVPDFLIWGWVVNEGALRSSFWSSQSGVGRFIRKIPSQSLWPLSSLAAGGWAWWFSSLLVRFMARWKLQTLLHVAAGGSEKDLKLWCFQRIFGRIQLLGIIWCTTYRWKEKQLLGFLVWLFAFFFLFSFFHVDKAVFHVLQGFTCQEPADICSSVHFEDVELFAGWGQRAQKVEE